MKLKNVAYYVACAFVCVACSGGSDSSSESTSNADGVVLAEDLARIGMPEKLDYLINNLVISDEMIGTLAGSDKSLFDASLLNPPEYARYYNTTKQKAVSMGGYGAELNYLIHFGQTEFSMKYMLASKQLADQIGVAMAFDQQAVEEYQTNVENKDSLINIIFVVYDNAKRMLKNEEQFMLSSLVIAGSWIENMYISTTLFSRAKSAQIKSKLLTNILEQKAYLAKLIEVIQALDEGDNVFVTELIQDLNKINEVYQNFGDRVLVENDVMLLNTSILNVRNRLVKVN